MGVQLINGRFDLSVAGVANMCGVVVGALMANGVPPLLAVPIAFAVGACVGILNGVLVTKLGTNAMVTTLGTWWACQGVAYGLTGGISFHRYSEGFQALGQGSILGIETPVWYMIIFAAVMSFVMAKTKFGYHVYATGGDRHAAELNGVKTVQLTIIVFVISAVAAAFCGIMYAARLNASAPMAVVGLEMRSIAASIIGGISMVGGEGLVIGSVLGMLFMYMLKNATVMIGISVYWEYSVLGLVLVAAVAFDAISRRRTSRS
jgi:ribose transport system permease protein